VRRPSPTYATLPSGLKLHYRVQGQSGAPWLVLINGLMSDTTMWTGVLPILSPRFRILTFDCRGQGRSEVPLDAPYRVEQHARDAWELLQVLGIEGPCLAGLSNGAFISLELLAAHPGAFPGAVLTSAIPHIDFTTRLRIQHWIQCFDLGGPLLQFDAAAPYLWGDRFLEQRHGILKAYAQTVLEQKKQAGNQINESYIGARLQMEGLLEWDCRERLGRVKDPLLLLAGAEDLLTPVWKCEDVARLIPGARFEVVPGVGHAFPVESPQAYGERLLGFLTEIKTIPPG
jgi:3-oxoadipate enol-lactonase